jgi:hypothetical protein
MLSREHIPPALIERSLASLIVLSLCLMSSAVSSCEISCLSRHIRCVDELVQSSPAAQLATDSASLEMGGTPEHSRLAMRTGAPSDSAVRRIESASCCSDELCKDASASAMLPTARTEFQNARWMAVGVVFAVNWSPRECLSNKTESPPPKAVGLNPLSISLRI